MATNALETQGMVIKIGDGGGTEVFTAIPEIVSFSGPGGSANVIDATNLSSTAKEKRMGLADEGQLQFTIRYVPANAQHAQLRTDRAARTLRNFKLEFTDSPVTVWDFSAYVTSFTVSGGVDALVEAQVSLEISGSIVES